METNHTNNGNEMISHYHYNTGTHVNGHTVHVETWSGNFRPYRGIVIDSEGKHVAHTGGFKSPSRALDKALVLARAI